MTRCIEHFGGRFPFWLAPTQVALIPIREEHAEYCRGLAQRLTAAGLRVDAMLQRAHMNKKIKEAEKAKVPFTLIAGERERDEGTVTIRRRGVEQQEVVPFEAFLELARRLQAERSLELT